MTRKIRISDRKTAMKMVPKSDLRPVSAAWRLALLCLLVVLVISAIGYAPTRALAGDTGVWSLLVGMGIALAAGLAGLLPPVVALRRPPHQRMVGVLTGMAIRFMLTLTLLILALLFGQVSKIALVTWTAIGYLAMLAVDTAGVTWMLKRAKRTAT
jgi:hypothetical protein